MKQITTTQVEQSLIYAAKIDKPTIDNICIKRSYGNKKEFAYEDCIIDFLIQKYNWRRICNRSVEHNNNYYHSLNNWKREYWNSFDQLKVGTWISSTYPTPSICPDIYAKNQFNDSVIIELKRFYHSPNTSNPFLSHDFNYLYGISPNINYSKKTKNICSNWIDAKTSYQWKGGPYIQEVNDSLTFWQEGQIWLDIARMLHLNSKNKDLKLLYFGGIVEANNMLNKQKFFTDLDKRIRELIIAYQQAGPSYIYSVYEENNPSCIPGNCADSLQRFNYLVNFDYEITTTKMPCNSNWATFLIQIIPK